MDTENQSEFNLEPPKKAEPGEKETRRKLGKYWVREHPSGSVTIFGNGFRERGVYVPPKKSVVQRAKREYKTQGALSQTTRTYVKNWGLLNPENQNRSLSSGLESLGIEDLHPQAIKLAEADRAFRSFWKARNIRTHDKRKLVHPSKRLPSIKEFKKKNPLSYQWIVHNVGMYKFMEQRHPGLYYQLSKRGYPISLDLNVLRRDLLSLINSGVGVNRNYLERSPEPNEKKLLNNINTIIRSRNGKKRKNPVDYFISKPNYLPPEVKTFNEIVSHLSGIPAEKIKREADAARDCGKLGEKFVECYILLSLRLGYEPLKLDLPDTSEIFFSQPRNDDEEVVTPEGWETEVHFNNKHTEYRYGKNKKGIADGRVGDTLLEVKVGARDFTELYTQQLIAKYSPNGVWHDGNPLTGSILFLHQEPKFYAPAKSKIESAGIKVVGFHEFHSALSSLLNLAAQKYNLLQRVEPQVNLPALLEGHKNLNLEKRMSLFCREGFSTQREWYREMLTGIIEEALQ